MHNKVKGFNVRYWLPLVNLSNHETIEEVESEEAQQYGNLNLWVNFCSVVSFMSVLYGQKLQGETLVDHGNHWLPLPNSNWVDDSRDLKFMVHFRCVLPSVDGLESHRLECAILFG